jgi:hypothetical protein
MLNESIDVAAESEARRSVGLKLLAVLCAVLVTGALLVGYAFMRKRHAQQTLEAATPVAPVDALPKGPPKAEIIVDEPLLKGTERLIGGRVRNISGHSLSGLTVHLELRRRKDGELIESLVSVDPSPLEVDQEGTYSIRVKAQDYGSVRLAGLSSEPNSTLLAYTSTQGKERPPERIESKTIIMRPGKRDEFLNSPDNPARVR